MLKNHNSLLMLRGEREQNVRLAISRIPDEGLQVEAGAEIRRISMATDTLIAEAKRLSEDQRLSDTGRKERFDELLATAESEIARSEQAAQGFAEKAAELEAALILPEAEGDRVIAYLQQQEIRQRLAGEGDLVLMNRYMADLQAGEYTPLVAALESDPLPRHFVTGDTRARSKHIRMMQTSPETLRRIESLNTASREVSSYAGRMRGLFR